MRALLDVPMLDPERAPLAARAVTCTVLAISVSIAPSAAHHSEGGGPWDAVRARERNCIEGRQFMGGSGKYEEGHSNSRARVPPVTNGGLMKTWDARRMEPATGQEEEIVTS